MCFRGDALRAFLARCDEAERYFAGDFGRATAEGHVCAFLCRKCALSCQDDDKLFAVHAREHQRRAGARRAAAAARGGEQRQEAFAKERGGWQARVVADLELRL